jgi:hypothetical protein
MPRFLSRVVLFTKQPNAILEVSKRMAPGGAFTVYRIPGCWRQLARKLPELRRAAQRIEPGWLQDSRVSDQIAELFE